MLHVIIVFPCTGNASLTHIFKVQFSPNKAMPISIARAGFHDNCVLRQLPWLPLLLLLEVCCELPFLLVQRFTRQADSGPNSGTSAALGLSETGLVGGVGRGVEEVIVLVVVEVVRSRYH